MQLTRNVNVLSTLLLVLSFALLTTARRRGDGFARDIVQDVVRRSNDLQSTAQTNLFAGPLVRVVPPKSKASKVAAAACQPGSDDGSGSASGTSSSSSSIAQPTSGSGSESGSSSSGDTSPSESASAEPASSSGVSAGNGVAQQPSVVTTVIVHPTSGAQSPANAQTSSASRSMMGLEVLAGVVSLFVVFVGL